MKNKKLFKTLLILALSVAILVIAAQSGICESEAVQTAVPIATDTVGQTSKNINNEIIAKFVIAMLGVAFSAVALFIGLWIYNKFFVNKSLFPSNNPDDVLNTPKTVNEAIVAFIKRNKL